MKVVRVVNGRLATMDIQLSAEEVAGVQRIPDLTVALATVVCDEAPNVAVTALLQTLAAALTYAADDPLKAARESGLALELLVKNYASLVAWSKLTGADRH